MFHALTLLMDQQARPSYHHETNVVLRRSTMQAVRQKILVLGSTDYRPDDVSVQP